MNTFKTDPRVPVDITDCPGIQDAQTKPIIIQGYGTYKKNNENVPYILDINTKLGHYATYIELYKKDIEATVEYIIMKLSRKQNDYGLVYAAKSVLTDSYILHNIRFPLGNYFNIIKEGVLKIYDSEKKSTPTTTPMVILTNFISELNDISAQFNGTFSVECNPSSPEKCKNYNLVQLNKTHGTFKNKYNGHPIVADSTGNYFIETYEKNKKELNENGKLVKELMRINRGDKVTEVVKKTRNKFPALTAINSNYTYGQGSNNNVKTLEDLLLDEPGFFKFVENTDKPIKTPVYTLIESGSCQSITIDLQISSNVDNSFNYGLPDGIKISNESPKYITIFNNKKLSNNILSILVPPTIQPPTSVSPLYMYNGNYYDTIEQLKTVVDHNNYTITFDQKQINSMTNQKNYNNTNMLKIVEKYNFIQNLVPTIITSNNLMVLYLKQYFLNVFEKDYNNYQQKVLIEDLKIYREDKYIDYGIDEKRKLKTVNLNELNKSQPKMKGGGPKEFCVSRNAEGVYINSFLADMRTGIARYINDTNGSKGFPSFFTKCLPLQCNPEFKDCLGIDRYTLKKKTDVNINYGALVNKIKELTSNSKEVVFCVFCVLNLSEPPSVVEPPKISYIDITELQQHFQILENYSIQKFIDPSVILTNISSAIQKITRSDQYTKHSKDLGLQDIIKRIDESIARYIKMKDESKISEIIQNIGVVIKKISNHNAATPIGTVLFTDSVAKNFANVNTCNSSNMITYDYGSQPKNHIDDTKVRN
jgi:hypothetical protein